MRFVCLLALSLVLLSLFAPAVRAVPADAFDFTSAVIEWSPDALGSWNATSALTLVSLGPSGVHVEFAQQNGTGRWPDVPFGSGTLQYTLGMAYFIDGTVGKLVVLTL
jgi:hypothetical protein